MKIEIDALNKYDIVKEYLYTSGLSQKEAARKYGVSQSTISYWVREYKDLVLREQAKEKEMIFLNLIDRLRVDMSDLSSRISFLEGTREERVDV